MVISFRQETEARHTADRRLMIGEVDQVGKEDQIKVECTGGLRRSLSNLPNLRILLNRLNQSTNKLTDPVHLGSLSTHRKRKIHYFLLQYRQRCPYNRKERKRTSKHTDRPFSRTRPRRPLTNASLLALHGEVNRV